MAAPPFLVVVTGLRAEARTALASGRTLVGGGDTARLASELDAALSDGAGAVLSFGLAAGLESGLAAGALVVPREIIFGAARYPTESGWSERLRARLGDADARPLLGVEAPLVSPQEKTRLHEATGAVAADMESHIAAKLASGAGRPFAALRVICDPAERRLPPSAASGMKPDGRVDIAAVLLSLLRAPAQLGDLFRVAADARTAMARLRQSRTVLGPEFSRPGSDRAGVHA